MRKQLIIILVILSLAFFSLVIFFSISREKASAQEDWLSGWNYRTKITVNPFGGGLTDYQMKVHIYKGSGTNTTEDGGKTLVIYLNNHVQNWPYDIRFTKDDGTTTIPFWRERYDADDGIWWVKIPQIHANLREDYYIYYGNPNVTNDTGGSNGNATFLYFDDWNSDDTGDFYHVPTTANNKEQDGYKVKSFSEGKKFITIGKLKNYWYGGYDFTQIGFTDNYDSIFYNDDHAALYWEHRSSNVNDTSKVWVKIRTEKSQTRYSTSLKGFAKPSPDDLLRIEFNYDDDIVSYSIKDLTTGSTLAQDSLTNTDEIPNLSVVDHFFVGTYSNRSESIQYSSPSSVKWWNSSSNGGMEFYSDVWFVGKYAYNPTQGPSPEVTWYGSGVEESASSLNNPPDTPTNPSPANGAADVSTSPTLSVDISDPDGDTMDVTFYNAADDSVIGTDSNVPSGGTASVTWNNLDYNTSYSWYTIASDGTDSTQSDTWTFTTGSAPNNSPNAPTLVSPPDGSNVSDDTPTLSAHYSDPDSGDTGVTHYRISSSSLSDCVNNVNVVVWGDSVETSTNDEDTSWTPSSSIGSDGTYYWCAQNDDGVDTSAWTEMGSFVLSTTSSGGCQHHNVWGWAWSERTGWISFSCQNCDSDLDGNWDGGDCGTGQSIDYGVDIDPDTGEMSGYAWSERAGYISFNSSDLSGCPSGTCEASVNLDTGQVSGWAKAVDASGWDGWVRLKGTTQDNNSYGVSVNTTGSVPHEFQGWAWSDDTIGWISFNCSNQNSCSTSDYKVLTDLSFETKPSVSNLSESWDYCGDSLHPTLSWDYSDGNSGGYEVQIATDSNFSNVILDYVSDSDNSTSYHPSSGCPPFSNSECDLEYNNTYYWRVRAKNQNDIWSDWSDPDSFNTPPHHFPQPNFSWNPSSPKVGEIVNFTDETSWASGAQKSWSWTFPDATPSSSSSQNPQVIFNSAGTKQVSLEATDSSLSEQGDCGAGCCKVSHSVDVRSALNPGWQEQHP